MPTVAQQLRQAREARNLTVQEVAEATKIRTDHVRALEEGLYDTFPAPVYIRGFVRTYAGFLKLDVDQLIDQVNEELGRAGKNPDVSAGSSGGGGISVINALLFQLWRVKWKIVLPLAIGGAALTIGIYGWRTWASHKAKDPLAALGPGLFQSRGDGETLPLPNTPRR